jgi:hypothetical protein
MAIIKATEMLASDYRHAALVLPHLRSEAFAGRLPSRDKPQPARRPSTSGNRKRADREHAQDDLRRTTRPTVHVREWYSKPVETPGFQIGQRTVVCGGRRAEEPSMP